ncbi:MAG: ABC transporter ATP-binding protein [Negativicutes bacterium]|nr:ABC transporter ATP-binding protein [Negativicutes bacterium]
MNSNEATLVVEGLKTSFYTDDGIVRSVDGVDFVVPKGKTLGLVGESGCGKSITALSILQLIPTPPGKIEAGKIIFQGKDLLTLSEKELQKIRGNRISMIFQEPMTSLNPVFTVGNQLAEAVKLHQGLDDKAAMNKAIEMLQLVGIPSPDKRVEQYPFELSGGMRQRVMIAMALSCKPDLLIADEPTTALDVTIQAQILDLLKKLQQEMGTSIIMITHDLGVVAETCDQVAVMYAGKIVEYGSADDLLMGPKHPYTEGLLKSSPRIGEAQERLDAIEGFVPSPYAMPPGCAFAPRCPYKMEICDEAMPNLLDIGDGRLLRCWLHGEGGTR